jgi:hypothetical protein
MYDLERAEELYYILHQRRMFELISEDCSEYGIT